MLNYISVLSRLLCFVWDVIRLGFYITVFSTELDLKKKKKDLGK